MLLYYICIDCTNLLTYLLTYLLIAIAIAIAIACMYCYSFALSNNNNSIKLNNINLIDNLSITYM